MISLSKGYARIRALRSGRSGSFEEILGISDSEATFLDPRIGEQFRGVGKASVHEIASYMHKQLVLARGPLIDERVLAARLGVDSKKSNGWSTLKSRITKKAGYCGAFCEAWPRWWNSAVEEWWCGLSKLDTPLKRLPPEARVAELIKRTRVKALLPARPISKDHSSLIWSICEVTEKPLDPVDGFRGHRPGEELLSWQEPIYLSHESIFDGSAKSGGFRVHPLERDRFNRLKEELRAARVD